MEYSGIAHQNIHLSIMLHAPAVNRIRRRGFGKVGIQRQSRHSVFAPNGFGSRFVVLATVAYDYHVMSLGGELPGVFETNAR